MAKRRVKPVGSTLDACEVCNGTECGTPRIPVCCDSCTH
jgi:hypothetical protein